MTVALEWSEWRVLMLESDYIKALHIGYLPFDLESLNDSSEPLRFCRGGSSAKRAIELRNPDLETGRVVSVAWRLEFFESQTRNLSKPNSDIWDMKRAWPLSAALHKLGLESFDREQVIVTFFAGPEVFEDMVPNRELDHDLALARGGNRVTAIGEAY